MSEMRNHLITSEESQALRTEYENKNYRFINSQRPDDQPDALDFSFDLDVLQDYLNLVREKTLELGINDVKIKIGMGQYAADSQNPKVNSAFKGYQTIFVSAADGSTSEYAGDCKIITEIDSLNFSKLCPPHNI